MPNTKSIFFPYFSSGAIGLYARVLQVSTSFWLDSVDGVFKLSPGNPNISLTEQVGGPSVYYFSENRSVWQDGLYFSYSYDSSNYLFGGAEYNVLNDSEISFTTIVEYIELIKKIEENNWELKNNQWIIYNNDGITPLITFNCYDSQGNLTMENIFKRRKI